MPYKTLVVFSLCVSVLASCRKDPDAVCRPAVMISVTETGGCRVDDVVVECGSVGPTLITKGVKSNCELHIAGLRSTSPAYYQAVGAVLVSLQSAGLKGGVGIRRVLPVERQ
jgi:hypothetical protein